MTTATAHTAHNHAEPETGPAEVRGIRPTDVGGIVFTWDVSVGTSNWRSAGKYEKSYIVSIGERSTDSVGRVGVEVEVRVIRNGQYRADGFTDKRWMLVDGETIRRCDEFGEPLLMIAAPIN